MLCVCHIVWWDEMWLCRVMCLGMVIFDAFVVLNKTCVLFFSEAACRVRGDVFAMGMHWY